MFLQLVDAVRDVLDAVLQDFLGDLFLIEDDNPLDRAYAALQILANDQDLADHNRRTRKRLQRVQLSALDALGNVNFPFAGEQRHRAHLAQVDARRIDCLFKRASGQVERDVLAGLHFLFKPVFEGRGGQPGRTFKHVNALRADGREQVAQILRGMHVVRNQVVHLIVGEIALFFSDINEFLNIVKSQAESLQRRPAWSKGCFVDRQRQLLKVLESKTGRMLARIPAIS